MYQDLEAAASLIREGEGGFWVGRGGTDGFCGRKPPGRARKRTLAQRGTKKAELLLGKMLNVMFDSKQIRYHL